MRKLMIIDGHSLLFQMFYGMPNKIKNRNGKNIEAVIGFVGAVLKAVKMISPDYIYVVFDGEVILKRQEKNSEYKNNRIDYSNIKEEDNPFAQLDFIKMALNELKINYLEMTDCEADDFIAGICNKKEKELEIIIMSQDKDFFQLISESVKVFSYRGKLSKLWGVKEVYDSFNIHPSQWVLYKALIGDSSDNIKGIKGIGAKTAVKLLNESKGLQDILSKFSMPESGQIKDNISLMDLSSNECPDVNINDCLCDLRQCTTMSVLKSAGIL